MTKEIDIITPAKEAFKELTPICLRGKTGKPILEIREEGMGYDKCSYWILRQDDIQLKRGVSAWYGCSYSDELAIEIRDNNIRMVKEMVEEWNNPKLDHIPTEILKKEIESRGE